MPLPTYPFERQRYWIEPRKATAVSQATALVKKPDITDWFYAPSWRRTVAEVLPKSNPAEARTSLVFSEGGAIAEHLSQQLKSRGHVVQARAAVAFRRVSPEIYEIDPANPEDYARLLRDLQSREHWPSRIVHAWMPDTNKEKDWDDILNRGIFNNMHLIQSMEEINPGKPIELNVVCDRAYSVIGEKISSPAASALNAFGMVVAAGMSQRPLSSD